MYNYPILQIPSATDNEKDAAQYMLYRGRVQYNLCGEFCVAFCAQDRAHTNNIDEFLKYWESTQLSWFNTLFRGGLARTTGLYDLEKMLAAYDYPLPIRKFSGGLGLKPMFVAQMLAFYQAIVGVHIDYTGYLVGKGIPHWVVLHSITIADENHAVVNLYNPFTNFIEPYSWKELMTSTGSYKQGLWVERLR